MAEEELTEDEVLVVKSIQFVLGNSKLAFTFGLEQILGGVDLEDGLATCRGLSTTDEEAHRLKFLFDVVASLFLGLAEIGIAGAVEVGNHFLPLGLQASEERRGHGDQRTTSVDDRWIAASLSYLRESVEQGLPCQSPCFDVRENVWVVSEGLEASCPAHNLLLVDATEHREAAAVTQAQTEGSTTNKSLVHQGPDEMLITPIRAHFWGEAENAV